MISMFVNLPWNKSKAQRLRIKIVDKYMEKKVFLNFFDKKKGSEKNETFVSLSF